MNILQFPLVKITFLFITGILLGNVFSSHNLIAPIALFLSLLNLIFIYFFQIKNHKKNLKFEILSLFTALFIGVFTTVLHKEILNTNHYIYNQTINEKQYDFEIILKEKLKNSINYDRFIANVNEFDHKKSAGKIILNVRKDSVYNDNLQIGDYIKTKGFIHKSEKPKNPGQFDYSNYLEKQQIYWQIYTNVQQIKINNTKVKSLNYYAAKLRSKVTQNLQKSNFKKEELSVVNALILGQQQDISKQIIQDYQYAGAIHVLSVSGLHVGCILIFIMFILSPIPNNKSGNFIKLIIVLFSLWFFGFIAGLSACVVRSVTMFSFLAIGKYLNRSVNIYHSLLVSILLILLFEPSFIYDVGFQLSYVALFFIVWLQPILSSIWMVKNKIVKYFWDITTVSFAAQIGTLPLSIYYFHQFPGLFFITNLVILPFLGFILAIGVFVVVLAIFNFTPYYLIKTLEFCITLLNKFINWVAGFESFIFKEISFTIYMMWACYFMIFCWIIWAKNASFKKFSLGLAGIILLQTSVIIAKSRSEKEHEFVVFDRKNSSLMVERNGNKSNIYTTRKDLKAIEKNQNLKSYLVENFSSIQNKKIISNLFFFKNHKIMVIDSSGIFIPNIKPDILILTGSPKINLERFLQNIKPKKVVADGSNFKNYTQIWKTTCLKNKILFHSTAENGFFEL